MNVEIQAINKILGTKETTLFTREGLTPDYFLAHREQVEFILGHKHKYGAVPDVATFATQFKDFPIIKTTETDTYIADKLREATLFQRIVPVVNNFSSKMRTDSIEATEYIMNAISTIRKEVTAGTSKGVDILQASQERYVDYLKRVSADGLLGITTGIKELDDATCGWLPEDHVVLFARTNEGKSWMAEYLAVQAWRAGKRVLYYAGEMSALMMGYRFDTLNRNVSNTQLLRGDADMAEEYKAYIDQLSNQSGFIVVTPSDFGGRKPTIAQIEAMCEDLNIDLVLLDQLSLLDDGKSTDNKTARYANISQDIMLASKRLQIPFITVAQANREAEKDKKAKESAPALHHVEYSDAIVQDATRVISMRYSEGLLTLSLKKNRFGGRNVDVMLKWEIDKGIIEPMLSEEELETLSDDFGF